MMNWAEVRAINSDLTKPLNKVIDEGIEGLQEVVDSIYIDENHITHTNLRGHIINNYDYDTDASWETNILKKDSGKFKYTPIYHNGDLYLFDYNYVKINGTQDYFYIYRYDGGESFERIACYQPITTNFSCSYGRIVQCGEDIYLLQSTGNNTTVYFYKFDWDRLGFYQSLTNPPMSVYQSQVLVFDGELHLISSHYSSSSNYPDVKKHYKWTGTEWVQVSNLPIDPNVSYSFLAVAYDDNLYLLGGNTLEGNNTSNKAVYKLVLGETVTDTRWDVVEGMQLPVSMTSWNQNWIIYNDKLCLLNSYGSNQFYIWDGETWTLSPRMTYTDSNNSTTAFNGSGSYAAIFEGLLYFFNVNNNKTGYNKIVSFDGENFHYTYEKLELVSQSFKIPGQEETISLVDPLDRSVIKSVQRGTSTFVNNSWREININPVNPNKCFLIIDPFYNPGNSYNTQQYSYYTFDDPTYYATILKIYNYTMGSCTFGWTLIEFY